jgi:hypothetical protein
MQRNQIVLGLVLLAGFACAAAIEEGHRTAAEPETPTYTSTDVHGGGYAAFATLLAREGVRVEPFEQRPGQLDDGIDTLVDAGIPFGQPSSQRTALDADDLRGWVERGGRVIVIGEFRRTPSPAGMMPPIVLTMHGGAPYTGPLAAGIASLYPAAPARFGRLPRGARVMLADRGGPLVVDVALGRGQVRYAVGVQKLLTNTFIGQHDNALVAYALAQPRRANGRVAFDDGVHGEVVDPSWWSIMPVWLRVASAGLALTLLLALGGGALRLGPPFVPPLPEPTSAAFLDAVTALYERAGRQPEVTPS